MNRKKVCLISIICIMSLLQVWKIHVNQPDIKEFKQKEVVKKIMDDLKVLNVRFNKSLRELIKARSLEQLRAEIVSDSRAFQSSKITLEKVEKLPVIDKILVILPQFKIVLNNDIENAQKAGINRDEINNIIKKETENIISSLPAQEREYVDKEVYRVKLAENV